MMDENDYLCPCAALTPESFLLGTLNKNGEADFIGSLVPVAGALWRTLQDIPNPEQHFRFTTRCCRTGCGQWAGGRCSLASSLVDSDPEIRSTRSCDCGIKPACRWLAQEGEAACGICRHIVPAEPA